MPLDDSGVSRGYGFVDFLEEESAIEAIQRVDGAIIEGLKVSVVKYIPKKDRAALDPPPHTFTSVYARNFPPSFTKENVETLFGKFGNVTSLFFSDSNASKPSFCVNYSQNDGALKCIQDLNL